MGQRRICCTENDRLIDSSHLGIDINTQWDQSTKYSGLQNFRNFKYTYIKPYMFQCLVASTALPLSKKCQTNLYRKIASGRNIIKLLEQLCK